MTNDLFDISDLEQFVDENNNNFNVIDRIEIDELPSINEEIADEKNDLFDISDLKQFADENNNNFNVIGRIEIDELPTNNEEIADENNNNFNVISRIEIDELPSNNEEIADEKNEENIDSGDICYVIDNDNRDQPIINEKKIDQMDEKLYIEAKKEIIKILKNLEIIKTDEDEKQIEKNMKFEEIFPDKPFKLSECKTTDIFQGHIGNCSMLSVLCVSLKFEILNKNILMEESDKYLRYTTYSKAKTTSVFISKKITICSINLNNRTRHVIYASRMKESRFPMMIEKGSAVVFDSYENICHILPHEWFMIFTGYPAYKEYIKSGDETSKEEYEKKKDYLFRRLKEEIGKRCFVFATGKTIEYSDSYEQKEFERINLIPLHAYAIFGVEEHSETIQDGNETIQLMNRYIRLFDLHRIINVNDFPDIGSEKYNYLNKELIPSGEFYWLYDDIYKNINRFFYSETFERMLEMNEIKELRFKTLEELNDIEIVPKGKLSFVIHFERKIDDQNWQEMNLNLNFILKLKYEFSQISQNSIIFHCSIQLFLFHN